MNFRGVAIFIWKGMAYLPSFGTLPSGIITHVEPIYVVNLNIPELAGSIEKILSSGLLPLPESTVNERKKRKSPVLVSTGAKSYKELDKNGIFYGIEWTEKGIQLVFYRLNKKKWQEIDPEKTRTLPSDTPLQEILKIILEDFNSHSDVPSEPYVSNVYSK